MLENITHLQLPTEASNLDVKKVGDELNEPSLTYSRDYKHENKNQDVEKA